MKLRAAVVFLINKQEQVQSLPDKACEHWLSKEISCHLEIVHVLVYPSNGTDSGILNDGDNTLIIVGLFEQKQLTCAHI